VGQGCRAISMREVVGGHGVGKTNVRILAQKYCDVTRGVFIATFPISTCFVVCPLTVTTGPACEAGPREVSLEFGLWG
jgi:hypothetical protein